MTSSSIVCFPVAFGFVCKVWDVCRKSEGKILAMVGFFFVCLFFIFLFWLVVVNWSVGPSGMRLERPFHALNPCLFFSFWSNQ